MVICPTCGSSRIRNDYQPAPLWLRLIGVRALLCDNCNHQFRIFAPLSPKSRRTRDATQKADVFNAAPKVNPHQLNGPGAEARPAPSAEPASINMLNRTRLTTDQITPVRHDLRTQITRLHEQSAKLAAEEPAPAQLHAQPSLPAAITQLCPECGSQNVRRRHRNLVEKLLLSFTAHKAYSCYGCGASFYAKKGEKHALRPLSPDRTWLESSAFNRERGWPERKG